MKDSDLPPPPERPDPDDCCGGGCVPCILEVYEEELERWQRRVEAHKQARDDDDPERRRDT